MEHVLATRSVIQEGIDSGPSIAADEVFAELTARYAGPKPCPIEKVTEKSRSQRVERVSHGARTDTSANT